MSNRFTSPVVAGRPSCLFWIKSQYIVKSFPKGLHMKKFVIYFTFYTSNLRISPLFRSFEFPDVDLYPFHQAVFTYI